MVLVLVCKPLVNARKSDFGCQHVSVSCHGAVAFTAIHVLVTSGRRHTTISFSGQKRERIEGNLPVMYARTYLVGRGRRLDRQRELVSPCIMLVMGLVLVPCNLLRRGRLSSL